MINFLKTCFFTFTIWIVAALLNSLLYAVFFHLGSIVQYNFIESIGLAFFFSLVFSVPALFCLWLVFLVNSEKENLSRILLKAVFILSIFSCVFIVVVPYEVYKGHWFLLAFNIILSSVISVMLHYRAFKLFYHSQRNTHV